MVSTAASNQLVNQSSAMETVTYSPSKDPVLNVPPAVSLEIKELELVEKIDDSEKNIESEKQESSDDTELITEETESNKSCLDSSSLSNMTILKEVKVVEQIGEKKIKKKFYWYGNHKLVKPIKDIPPRFQLMLAETNAEKARCEGRPIILQQDSNPNASSEATRGSTSFNPEAQCFVPHRPYKAKICSNEGLITPEGKESSVSNSEMLTPVTGPSVPFNPVPPMYTIHIYSNSSNSTNSTGAPTPVTNPCCMHLPNTSSSMYGSANTVPPPIQGPVYYTSQPYTQQTYPTTQYSPGFMTAAAGTSATVPHSVQYAPCFTYTQNTQFSTVALPQ